MNDVLNIFVIKEQQAAKWLCKAWDRYREAYAASLTATSSTDRYELIKNLEEAKKAYKAALTELVEWKKLFRLDKELS